MKDWIEEEIKRLEKERDRNLAIHCDYVAAKYQRMIDKIKICLLYTSPSPRDRG